MPGKNAKKCIVLDLDNTLWGGIVGEDGIENIALSLKPPGNGYMAFQQALLDHYDRGVILAINSRNNPEDAWEVIRKHPNMILKENHFASIRMNWNDKTQNIKEIAKELNIGLDSMVFLDDDPTNREMMRALVPEVETPDLPSNPAQYAKFLNSSNYFSNQIITDEDKMRGNLYVTERLRKEEEKVFANKEDFLKNLSLELFFYEDNNSCVPRLAQLTEKTNQFNTFKKPLSEKEIAEFIKSPNHTVFYASLQDKFGDYGVIAFALVEWNNERGNIRSLLMSCRVFGRGVEDAFFKALSDRALRKGTNRLSIDIETTEKNLPAREFVAKTFNNGEYKILETNSHPKWIKIIYDTKTM